MKSEPDNPAGNLQEQAGYWVFTRHSPDWTPAEETRLQAWLAQSEAHRREYERALKLWQRLDRFKSASFPARDNAQRLHSKQVKRRQRVQAAKRAATTGILVLALAAGLNDYVTTTRYRTAIGQRQTIVLADGSEVTLNTDTELSVKITDNRRLVSIDRGEAYFAVVHDAARPFTVIAAHSSIRDIGTRFNVYTGLDMTQVTVAEGEVAIAPDTRVTQNPWLDHLLSNARRWLPVRNDTAVKSTHLVAGQQLAYNSLGESAGLARADVGKVTAWRDGRLVFEMAALDEVLAQVQRYHPVEFQFADDKLRQIKVSASFDSDNLGVILSSLQAAFPIKAQKLDERRIAIAAAKG